MVSRAYRQWRKYSRVAGRGVPSHPSAVSVIRAKYADILPIQTPSLWFGSYGHYENGKDTPVNRARFARAYEMLDEYVHGGTSAREIGALRGISGSRATQLMTCAAYTWAARERQDLWGKSVPFKNEAGLVKNLYAGLKFFAQQHFNELAAKEAAKGASPNGDQIHS